MNSARDGLTLIGPHRLLCGDLTCGVVASLMGDERADVVYSDPPWGPGNQQYWHTMHVRGSAPRTSWPLFLESFCQAVTTHRKPDAPVLVEMGMRWVDELDAAMADVGLVATARHTITYGPRAKPLPNTLSVYGATVPLALPVPPHGEPVTRAALAAVVTPGALVLDPCTGLGMTARVTHTLGGVFRGTEMNAARLERTATWLRRHVENPGFWGNEARRRAEQP